ncbi:MAG: ACT domain-containing protein [Caldilineales bacterium]
MTVQLAPRGETDLAVLLRTMQPVLHESPYVFCVVEEAALLCLPFPPLGLFREREGITVILTQAQAAAQGLPYADVWACITLEVHSALAAVGFLAALSTALAAAGISVNALSAFYHDHLFVPWPQRQQALATLAALSRSDAGAQ